MRAAFVKTLCALAESDERIVLLTADLGYMALEPFRCRFPTRFWNVGVAEQNMVGVATGLAEAGFLPFTYSIATFASLRPFEFIRNGPVLHHLPVRIVGMGMGFEYGHAGPSHHALEDVSVMRTMPGLTTIIPADPQQASEALNRTWDLPGPVYYSLGKDDATHIPDLCGRFDLARVQVVRTGADIAIVTMGSIAREAVAASDQLRSTGINSSVIIVSNFNPDPAAHLAEILSGVRHVISLEAQTISGGLSAFVSSVVASLGLPCRVWPLAVKVSPDGTSGSQVNSWKSHRIDRQAVVEQAMAVSTGCLV